MAKTPVIPGEAPTDASPPDLPDPPAPGEPPAPLTIEQQVAILMENQAKQAEVIKSQKALLDIVLGGKADPTKPAVVLPTQAEAMAQSRQSGQGVLSRDGWVVWSAPPAPATR